MVLMRASSSATEKLAAPTPFKKHSATIDADGKEIFICLVEPSLFLFFVCLFFWRCSDTFHVLMYVLCVYIVLICIILMSRRDMSRRLNDVA